MNVLESPIDALAFGYVSYGVLNIVNNLWTWVAFVTAAVSFWRIRSAGAVSSSVKCVPPISQKAREVLPQTDRPVENQNPRFQTSAPAQSPAPAAAASSEAVSGFEVNGVSRGKFTVFYEDEGESDGGLTGVKLSEYEESEVLCSEWWESWERVLRTRRGERSWYSYQDLTVINGNVVRLWDGGVWKEKYSSRGAVW
ncbi:hypothetical protein HS088_TW04G00351 [Tripterygium wilfordii]|uniref:Uncharacterized protein n=1 Tax=Tripterygium wilfordii TaxID=458696 RepID=A0A7J7DPY5_TRIWF|nr:uncharacterized protein LOC119997497 [Tripterygium wilfordii]KAF5748398.1 hypothetical protein HS088_TW04G00351 [Tripterygium wilfordii]